MRDVLQLLAPTEKQLRGLSPPCFPFLNRRTRAGLRSSFLPPSSARPPTVILTWLPLLLCHSPPGTGHSLACIMPLSLLQARLEHVQSTSQICSMSRAGFMPIRSMLRFPRCFARSPLAPCPLLLRWLTRTRLCWQRKKNGQAASHQDGRVPSLCLRQASGESVSGAPSHQRPCTCISGVSTCQGRAKPCVTGGGTIEPLVLNGTIEPLVAADLDLVNMFGNAEWPHIRAALRTHFPEASVLD